MNDTIQEYVMPIQAYIVSVLQKDFDFASPPVLTAQLEWRIEAMAHQLTATLKLPAEVLQDDKVIAEYPTTLWDYIKRQFRCNYTRTQVRLTEHLVFPNVATPPQLLGEARMYTMDRITSYDPSKEVSSEW